MDFHSHDFLSNYLLLNSKVAAWAVTGDYLVKGTPEAQPEKVDANERFLKDFQINHKSDWKLWE